MKRLAAASWIITATAMIVLVFHISLEVQGLEEDLQAVRATLGKNREAVRVLEAEWSFLNRPEAIASLSSRYLELQPLSGNQFIDFAELPARSPATGDPTQQQPSLASMGIAQ